MNIESTFTDPDHGGAVAGMDYKDFLAVLHHELAPQNYFEIGTDAGHSLALAHCPSVAVDPEFKLSFDFMVDKPLCLLFQETSDVFFRDRNISTILGAPVDLAFLDGMHLAEYLLRDFINTERHCHQRSLVTLHDCLPPGFLMTTRDQDDPRRSLSNFPHYWTGDVWQVVPILLRYRPDLSITITDCAPTGLVVIANLDPTSDVLARAYDDIVRDHLPTLSDRAAYDAYWAHVAITPAAGFLDDLTAHHNFALEPEPAVQSAMSATGAVPRNAFCPCGSGRKYKHCHGRIA